MNFERKKCYIVNVSWGQNKKFLKVFKTRYDAEQFFKYVMAGMEQSYPNSTMFSDMQRNKKWYLSPVDEKDVFVSLQSQDFISSALVISEYDNYMSSENED